ncbi:MAG: PAC2 family protein [Promethearchaeota archaeon]
MAAKKSKPGTERRFVSPIVLYGPLGPAHLSALVVSNLIHVFSAPREESTIVPSNHVPARAKITSSGETKLPNHEAYRVRAQLRGIDGPEDCGDNAGDQFVELLLVRNNFRTRNERDCALIGRDLASVFSKWGVQLVVVLACLESEDEDLLGKVFGIVASSTPPDFAEKVRELDPAPPGTELTELSNALARACEELGLPWLGLVCFSTCKDIEDTLAVSVSETLSSVLGLRLEGVNFEYIEQKARKLRAEVRELIKKQLERESSERARNGGERPQYIG